MMMLAIHFGRTWERAAGTFAIYPLPRLMTSLALLFWYAFQFTPCWHWEANRRHTLSCSLVHCSAGNAHWFVFFLLLCFFLFCCFHRVLGRFHDRTCTCTSACHVDLNILTNKIIFLFELILWHSRCINLHVISLSPTWLCVCTHLHEYIIHSTAYDLVCVLNRSEFPGMFRVFCPHQVWISGILALIALVHKSWFMLKALNCSFRD